MDKKKPKITDLPEPKRYEVMPDCEWHPLTHIRFYTDARRGTTTLEMAYQDGNGDVFWGPVPKVIGNRI
jgi:hypothetical protein